MCYKGKLFFLSVLFPTLCSNFCLEKNYLRCLRFWFGGNLERELGEAFSLSSSPWEGRKCLTKIFCVCVNIRRWQAAPSCFFLFFLFCFWKVFPRPEWVWHVCPILLFFDIFFEPFHKSTCHGLKMGVPHCRLARLQAGTELLRC